MNKKKISIAVVDYSNSPGPRYCSQGEYSGEDFYCTILKREFQNAVENKIILEVNLDGTDRYASSFLDEAFGNLVFDFGLENVQNYLRIISEEEPELAEMITKRFFLDGQ